MTTAVLTHSPARTDHRARWSVAAGQIFRRWSVNTVREAWGVGVEQPQQQSGRQSEPTQHAIPTHPTRTL